ncbi:MAG TPA: DMT family transporter [Anaerolineae bacterium]|nr:DMT family transporter [Anaerolineae bacterium]
MTSRRRAQQRGIAAALLSAVFLGTAPIFGKQAYAAGMTPIPLAAWRILIAAAGLWLVYALIGRRYLYIYPAGLIGCAAVGAVNGIGSLMYYSGLERVDAGVGQMIYSLYPLFLVIFLRLDGHRFSGLTLFRMALAIVAIALITQTGGGPVDVVGLGLMLGAGFAYALHLAIGQRVSYEMPAQTLTLYAVTSMAVVVCAANLIAGWSSVPSAAWQPTLGLAFVTVASRLGMFLGVKRLGSMQTALIGITEILVTLILALTLLDETLSSRQWIGAGLLVASLLLIGREPTFGGALPRQVQPAASRSSSMATESQ